RKIYAVAGIATVDVVHDSARHEIADVLLRFECAASDVRREDRVWQAAQFRNEFLIIADRLVWKYVYCTARYCSVQNTFPQRFYIHHMTATEVEENDSFFHLRKFGDTNDVGVAFTTIDVECQYIGLTQHLFQRFALRCIAERKFF